MSFGGNGGAGGRVRTLVCAVAMAATSAVANAEDWSATNIQLLHGRHFKLGPSQRDIMTFEHVSGWQLGSNFFFFDVTQPFTDGTDIYGEWYGRLSWNKLGITSKGTGLLEDVSFAGSLNAGAGFRAYLAGLTLHFKLPGFSFFDLDVMAYDDRSDSDVTYIVTPAWEAPFTLGKAHFRFRGFVDIIGAEGLRARQVLAQPQVLLDIGRLVGRQDRFFAGIEYQLWHNKFGVRRVDEALTQVMVLWQL
jgi:nucleoside-specific outer membrane channel protein Tsx